MGSEVTPWVRCCRRTHGWGRGAVHGDSPRQGLPRVLHRRTPCYGPQFPTARSTRGVCQHAGQTEARYVLRMHDDRVPGAGGNRSVQLGRHKKSAIPGCIRFGVVRRRSHKWCAPWLRVDGVGPHRHGRRCQPGFVVAVCVGYAGVGDLWKLLKVAGQLSTALRTVEDRHVGRSTRVSCRVRGRGTAGRRASLMSVVE
jgi:hypothetical protein